MKPPWSHHGAAIEPHLPGQACYSSFDLSLAQLAGQVLWLDCGHVTLGWLALRPKLAAACSWL